MYMKTTSLCKGLKIFALLPFSFSLTFAPQDKEVQLVHYL